MDDRCPICEGELPSRDSREHRQGRPHAYCSADCKKTARWIRDLREIAANTAARGFPKAVDKVEASIAKRLAELRVFE
jgi:hypothetical protein